jgi:subtilisin family serine protease
MQFKNQKFTMTLLLAGFITFGCESDLALVEPAIEAKLEEETFSKSFNLSEIKEMTDFTNLRQGDFTGRFLILSRGNNLPANIERSIASAGGEIVKTFPEIGVAVAVSRSDNFLSQASTISGIESITPDMILQYTKEPSLIGDEQVIERGQNGISSRKVTSSGTPFNYQDAFFDGWQWAPGSIDAPKAWDNGFTGEGIRVAVIDGGFHSAHTDLAPNLDVERSRSTVPGLNFNQDLGTFWHGTHVAGIVAASGDGIVGIAPKATIIGVKSLHSGSGAFEWILEGILYAATPQSKGGAGAQIINMSLGAEFPIRELWQEEGFRKAFQELQKVYDRATTYAYQNGVTIIASAGNGASNYDVERGLFKFPAQNRHVLSISSTGPTGWVLGNENFTQLAYYSDHGKALLDFAAPGGTAGLALVDGNFNPCTLIGTFISTTATCAVFDQVFSTVRGRTNSSYNWAQGTSMASPAVAGVVALMMEANGGSMNPAQVKTRLIQSSTDLGKPGQDEIYGHGYVNAAKAVGLN